MRVLTYNQVRFCYTSLKNPCNIILNCCAGRNLITGMLPFSLFLHPFGDLSEWLKEHAWKVCIPLKGIEGSNPSVSAKMKRN